jgi:putative oxidoreductase
MKGLLSHRYALMASRAILGTVFILASIDKIASPAVFAASIEAYGMLPLWSVNMAALIVPWLELLCGVFLFGGVYIRGSSSVAGALLAVFIVAISSAILRGLAIDCGCFGAGAVTPVGWMRVIEDAGLLVLSVHVLTGSPRETGGVSREASDGLSGL